MIFAVSALAVYLEYRRQTRNTARHEKSQSDTLSALAQQVEQLHLRLARLEVAEGLPAGPAPLPVASEGDSSQSAPAASSASSSSPSPKTTSSIVNAHTQGSSTGASTHDAQITTQSSAVSSGKQSAASDKKK